jgi:hypothetical protein
MGKGHEIAGEVLELRNCALCGSSLAMDCGDRPESIPQMHAVRAS